MKKKKKKNTPPKKNQKKKPQKNFNPPPPPPLSKILVAPLIANKLCIVFLKAHFPLFSPDQWEVLLLIKCSRVLNQPLLIT